MKQNEHYLIGVLSRAHSEVDRYWDGWPVVFSGSNQVVSLLEGPSGHYHGSTKRIVEWLHFRPRSIVEVEGKRQMVEAPSGWFERKLAEAGCGWFIPIAHRIAAGEKVPLEEITSAYAAANQGQPMPRGTIEELFAYAKQRGLLK